MWVKQHFFLNQMKRHGAKKTQHRTTEHTLAGGSGFCGAAWAKALEEEDIPWGVATHFGTDIKRQRHER